MFTVRTFRNLVRLGKAVVAQLNARLKVIKLVRPWNSNHERKNDWNKHVGWGNELCCNFTPVGSADRNRVEAAYIYEHKPPENTEYKNHFPFDTTTVSTSGRAALLKPYFTVYSSVGASVMWPYR